MDKVALISHMKIRQYLTIWNSNPEIKILFFGGALDKDLSAPEKLLAQMIWNPTK